MMSVRSGRWRRRAIDRREGSRAREHSRPRHGNAAAAACSWSSGSRHHVFLVGQVIADVLDDEVDGDWRII